MTVVEGSGPRRDALCSVDGCGRRIRTRGLCAAHYRRLSKHGDVAAETPIRQTSIRRMADGDCVVEGCARPKVARDLCDTHYHRFARGMSKKEIHAPGNLKDEVRANMRRRQEKFLAECEGMTPEQAAAHLGVCREVVNDHARGHDGFLRKYAHQRDLHAATLRTIDRAKELADKGMTKAEAAKVIDIPPHRLYQMLSRYAPDHEWRDGRTRRACAS